MATSSPMLRKFLAVLSLSAVAGFTPVTGNSLIGFDAAKAQNIVVGGSSARRDRLFRQDGFRRSGVFFGNRRGNNVFPVYRDPALQRLGLRQQGSVSVGTGRFDRRRTNARRAGVRQGGRFVGTEQNRFFKRRDLLFVERQRELRQRNRQIERQRSNDAFNRGQVFISPGFGNDAGIILLDDDNLVINSGVTVTTPCPVNHNCGYRLYTDGTGPRIIRPNDPSNYGYDGLSGPKVITLDQIN